MRAASQISRNDPAWKNQSAPRQEKRANVGDAERSSYGTIPGDEFPPVVYRSVGLAFAWMLAAAWLAFGSASGTDLDLALATVLFTVFLALPVLLYRTARNRLPRNGSEGPHPAAKQFLSSRVDIATGTLSGREAWLQVILIPAGLALAATIIGGAYAFLG